MITAVMTPKAITTGLVLLALGVLALAFWAMRDERNPGPLFTEVPAAPGRCSCGAPHALKPFPGDVPAAPVAGPVPLPGYVLDAIGHGGNVDAYLDSAWSKADGEALAAQIRGAE